MKFFNLGIVLKKEKMGYKHSYNVYFKVGHPSDDFSKKEEIKIGVRLENPNDFVEAANALKTYGYPNPESIRIIRIE